MVDRPNFWWPDVKRFAFYLALSLEQAPSAAPGDTRQPRSARHPIDGLWVGIGGFSTRRTNRSITLSPDPFIGLGTVSATDIAERRTCLLIAAPHRRAPLPPQSVTNNCYRRAVFSNLLQHHPIKRRYTRRAGPVPNMEKMLIFASGCRSLSVKSAPICSSVVRDVIAFRCTTLLFE